MNPSRILLASAVALLLFPPPLAHAKLGLEVIGELFRTVHVATLILSILNVALSLRIKSRWNLAYSLFNLVLAILGPFKLLAFFAVPLLGVPIHFTVLFVLVGVPLLKEWYRELPDSRAVVLRASALVISLVVLLFALQEVQAVPLTDSYRLNRFITKGAGFLLAGFPIYFVMKPFRHSHAGTFRSLFWVHGILAVLYIAWNYVDIWNPFANQG